MRNFAPSFRRVYGYEKCQVHIYNSVFAVLAIVGCGRGADDEGLTHDEVRAINERVLEKAIGQPDSALMMIERLRNLP